jgi:alpha-amylase/alpha-mannosidase (GH57 family)
MESQARTSVALLWHMHQPLYRDLSRPDARDAYRFPWVRLHAIRDYFPMALRAATIPDLHFTINVTPCLLWQIEDYVERSATDRALTLSAIPAEALNSEEREELISTFFDADLHNEILIHERYGELLNLRSKGKSFRPQDIRDLQMWFNLAWFADEFRSGDVTLPDGHVVSVHRYVNQQRGFSHADIRTALDEQLRVMRAIVPYYKSLQENGTIEVSVTPFFHPILPLLIDTDTATLDRPGTSWPKRFSRPEDAASQVRLAVEFYRERFGVPPQGIWPAEAAVSEAMLPVIAKQGIRWIASDEGVLAKSGKWGYMVSDPNVRCRAYQAPTTEGSLSIFFRDAKLSNLIGFELQSIPDPKRAADEFMRTLDMRVQGSRSPGIVSIILDGENPWGAYSRNGRPFLQELYARLTSADAYRTVTFSEYLDGNANRAVASHPTNSSARVYKLFTGSWIDEPRSAPGVDLGTWIGEEEENKAWELLGGVRDFVARTESSAPVADIVMQCLYAAEGSDWFWWFGDDQESGRDDEFDDLFRGHLKAVYRLLDQLAPLELSVPIVARKRTWALSAPIATAFVGDRLSIQTNCPGTVRWWMPAGESGQLALQRAGGVLAGQSHHSAEVGPLRAGTLHFTISCSGCTCPERCPACTGEEHTVEVVERATHPARGIVGDAEPTAGQLPSRKIAI